MKKIGCVLAVRRKNHNNYGTTLQAYATVNFKIIKLRCGNYKVYKKGGYGERYVLYLNI